MKDRFFHQQHCDRCCGSLEGGRIMSRFDTSCICLDCSESEKQDPDYRKAVEAEADEIRRGNYNYKGLWSSTIKPHTHVNNKDDKEM